MRARGIEVLRAEETKREAETREEENREEENRDGGAPTAILKREVDTARREKGQTPFFTDSLPSCTLPSPCRPPRALILPLAIPLSTLKTPFLASTSARDWSPRRADCDAASQAEQGWTFPDHRRCGRMRVHVCCARQLRAHVCSVRYWAHVRCRSTHAERERERENERASERASKEGRGGGAA